jgi:hypothetical protein
VGFSVVQYGWYILMSAYASLAALTAEHDLMTQAKQIKARPVYFTIEELQAIAADCIPAQRKRTAERYLTEIHGEHIPPSEYLDGVFGLDLVITYKGWLIGLDVTLDREALPGKQRKQAYLSDAYGPNGLGLDRWAVVLAPCPDLKAEISAIIKG